MGLPDPPVLVITDRTQAAVPLPDLADILFAAGLRWLSLRDKDLEAGERAALARALVVRARPWGAVVTLHGDPALAAAVGAAGVHLPDGGDGVEGGEVAAARARLGPGALVGLSAHDGAGLARAAAFGADYATLSPVFASSSKPGYGPVFGEAGLSRAVSESRLPIVALGGLESAEAVARCRRAGAAGVAIMGQAMRNPWAIADALAAARRR